MVDSEMNIDSIGNGLNRLSYSGAIVINNFSGVFFLEVHTMHTPSNEENIRDLSTFKG